MTHYAALPPAVDHTTAPGLGAPRPQGHENPFEIFHRIHRLLRGRYLYVFIYCTIGAVAGAVVGWLLTVPKYQSVGMIRIKNPSTRVYQIQDMQGNSSVRSIANLIQEPRVVDHAMGMDEWKKFKRGLDPDARLDFRNSLRVETDPAATEWIYVKFTDKDPAAAQVAVEQVMKSYVDIHGDEDVVISPQLIAELQSKARTYESEIRNLVSQKLALGKDFGVTDLEPLYLDSLNQLRDLDRTFRQLDLQIKRAEAEPPAPNETPAPAADDAELDRQAPDVAKSDDTVKELVNHLSEARSYLDLLLTRLTESHPSVIKQRATVKGMETQVRNAVRKYLDNHGGVALSLEGGNRRLTDDELKSLKKYFEGVRATRDDVMANTAKLNQQRMIIADKDEQIKRQQSLKDDVERRLTQLTTEQGASDQKDGPARVNIISFGELPHRPSIDNRRKLAVLGFMFGAGVPLSLILLWGLIDRRYRYSDDASDPVRPMLLGILPYLPEQMADPEQAAVAAHCVHQIRTLLQISAAQQDRRVFAITSPTSGDGKTSLSLSLALSFASSGANTCLIDFDLIGRGLTSAMNAKSELGVMDAVDRAELNGHIKVTGFKRLSLVPAGDHDAQHVARLSPDAVRAVIKQARQKFDVVIIDTGPVLGSIEAALVASASDSVILALGRGQARPLVDRAMERLTAIGASVIGVVFNRAQPDDFRRAISSASVRSVPNQGAATPMPGLPAMGPMARTVAHQSRPSEPTDAH